MKRIAARLAKEKAWDQVGQSILERVFKLPEYDHALIPMDFFKGTTSSCSTSCTETEQTEELSYCASAGSNLEDHVTGIVWQALIVCVAAVCVQ